jgi:hypothetical protein
MTTAPWSPELVLAALPADGSRVLWAKVVEDSGLRPREARIALAVLCTDGRAVVESDHGFTWARRGKR